MLCCFIASANVGKVLTGISKGSFWSKHIVESRPLDSCCTRERRENIEQKSHCKPFPRAQAQSPQGLKPGQPWALPPHPPAPSLPLLPHPCQPSTQLQSGDISQGWVLRYFVEHSLKRRWKLPLAKIIPTGIFQPVWGRHSTCKDQRKRIIFLILLPKKAPLKNQNKQNLPKRGIKEDPNKDDNYWHSTLSQMSRSEHGI